MIEPLVLCPSVELRFKNSLMTDASSQYKVLHLEGGPLGVNGAQVGVFKQLHEKRFCRFLECHDGLGAETNVVLHVLSNVAHHTLERGSANQQVRCLLVLADLTESSHAWSRTPLLPGGGGLRGCQGAWCLASQCGLARP